jgi:hypothetical protein
MHTYFGSQNQVIQETSCWLAYNNALVFVRPASGTTTANMSHTQLVWHAHKVEAGPQAATAGVDNAQSMLGTRIIQATYQSGLPAVYCRTLTATARLDTHDLGWMTWAVGL